MENQVMNKYFFFSFLTLIFLTFSFPAYSQSKPVMLFFYSKDCEHCERVKKEFLPGFLKKYGPKINFTELEASVKANGDSLFAMESRVNFPEEDKEFPAVYFMGTMIESETQIRLGLETLMKNYLSNPDSAKKIDAEIMAKIPEKITAVEPEGSKIVNIAYFFKLGCKECSRDREIIEWLNGLYTNIKVESFDIADKKNKVLATWLGIKNGVPEKRIMSTPAFFIGNDYLLSDDISRKNLAGLVQKYSKTGSKDIWNNFSDEEKQKASDFIRQEFRSFAVLAVIFAGLGDGVNPCAFATIIFFVSYLTMVGRKRNEILFVGLSFAFAVFVTYFLVGLGFFQFIKMVSNIALVSKIIFGGTAVLCVIFGFLSIYDYFMAKKSKTSEMTLQLPQFLKKRIHATIREKAKTESIVAGALVAGFIVSILEFACTGQVYLPTITFMVGMEGQTAIAVLYLLIYNLCFILPLIVVFSVVYFGVSSKSIAKVMESRVGTVKIILAVVFFVVAGLLFWAVFL